MPVMDGLELVQAIRRDYPALPVILMTAMGSEDVAARALHQGAASYVRKRQPGPGGRPDRGERPGRCPGPPPAGAGARLPDRRPARLRPRQRPRPVPPLLGYLEQVASLLHPRDRTERIRVGIALNEALLNAIQHGNLELNSDLRQEDEQVFRDLGEERRRQPPYRDRRVHVRATLSRSEAVYVVEDEGPGFDPATVPVPSDPANLERIGGRGLMLIRTFMDEVEHNEKGNRITLRKRYPTLRVRSAPVKSRLSRCRQQGGHPRPGLAGGRPGLGWLDSFHQRSWFTWGRPDD